jgi:hypothetical protein
MHSSSPLFLLHCLPTPSSLTWSFWLYLTKCNRPNILSLSDLGMATGSLERNNSISYLWLPWCTRTRRRLHSSEAGFTCIAFSLMVFWNQA